MGKFVAELDQINTTYWVLTWMDRIKEYILKGKLPEDREEAKNVKNKSSRYSVIDETFV